METNQSLERRTITRMRFLEDVVDFGISITKEYGRLLQHTNGSFVARTIRELHNFGGFSFYVDIGMGNNTLIVWYHPGQLWEKRFIPALCITWQTDVEKCIEHLFDPSFQWQWHARKVRQRRKSIGDRIDQAIAATEKENVLPSRKKPRRKPVEIKIRVHHTGTAFSF